MNLLADIIVKAGPLAREIKKALIGRRCWYAYVSIGNTFQISLGRKIARDAMELAAIASLRKKRLARQAAKGVRVSEDHLSREFDRFTGEANLLAWCPWRLDGKRGPVVRPITSWDDDPARCLAGIRRLMGRAVRSATIEFGWFLKLNFSGGFTLNVFPTHVGANASFDGNWELRTPDAAYEIDTELTCQVRSRKAGAVVADVGHQRRQSLLREAV